MLRIASYNIRKSVGTDWRRRPHEILEVLKEIDADVVALQEVDRSFGSRLSSLPPKTIQEQTHYRPLPLGMFAGRLGWYGNAILVKDRITLLRTDRFKLPALEPRGAAVAELAVGDGALRVVAMHLGLLGLWRRRQVRAVLEHLKATEHPMPTVMLGDFNEWNPEGRCLKLFARNHNLLKPGPSFPSRMPLGALDRIVLSRDIEVVETAVHKSTRSRGASDHLPVWADIVFPGSETTERPSSPLQSHA
ncbi:endonuclease/exonuclease/phosphatase family protein [Jiella marina]|uniref:endonuclease/exonuclease/phosphatase family protein n=1 Tax=Jiella sp. LLJ827 TaxID=2917712 RepID=UPI0021009931|nr:endonuclease/exonuclease/phosphatase family protein [Jiella sp. LLJ827]MCQ0987508.1 endonuclease/exonuclease/phosphatase family protein [Jiella sp. LLJ827]